MSLFSAAVWASNSYGLVTAQTAPGESDFSRSKADPTAQPSDGTAEQKQTFRTLFTHDARTTPQHLESPKMKDGPTSAEIDAKIAAVEARSETNYVKLDGKLDRLADAILGNRGIVSQMQEIKADNRTTRWTIIVTVVASVLAALAALWTTQGNLLSALQTNLTAKSVYISDTRNPKSISPITK